MELPELSEGIRKLIKTASVFLAIGIALWLVWMFSTTISKFIFRPQLKDVAYGTLAQPSFSQLYTPLSSETWDLSGELPPSQEKIPVFPVIKGQFLETQQKTILKEFGINGKAEELDTGVEKYRSGDATLILNSSEGQYSYKVDYSNPVKNFTFSRLGLQEDEVVARAEEILQKQGLLTGDLKNGLIETNLLLLSGKTRQKISAANANAAEIVFYRKVEDLYGTGDPMVKILFGGSDRKILELEYSYYYLDPYGSSYPIKDSSKAWEELQDGEGFADNIEKQDSISVSDMQLAYWESTLAQSYIQPVWVFDCVGKLGDKETSFKAYLPAITSSFLVSSD